MMIILCLVSTTTVAVRDTKMKAGFETDLGSLERMSSERETIIATLLLAIEWIDTQQSVLCWIVVRQRIEIFRHRKIRRTMDRPPVKAVSRAIVGVVMTPVVGIDDRTRLSRHF
jgi:hypothetical protein